jgi:toxin ParE1/3/4
MVNKFTFSKKADLDIKEIFKYTFLEYGEKQAYEYINGLENSLRLIVESPNIGRNYDWLRIDCQRHEIVSHVIFYKQRKHDIFVIRILHKNMDVKNHL